MAHKMGLAAITIGTKSIPKTRYFNSSETSYTDDGSVSVTASNTFSGNLPYLDSSTSTYYAIVKNSTPTTFQGTGTDGWITPFNANIASGCYNSFEAESKRLYRYKGWKYEFTGGMQSFSVPVTGSYLLEVWGGRGGSHSAFPSNCTKQYGGYSKGNKTFSSLPATLYVCVGGEGGISRSHTGETTIAGGAGGYNGGGKGGSSAAESSRMGGGGGGGASHIATATGTLYTLLNGTAAQKSSVLIVAGGGGGYGNFSYGGSGGGATGGGSEYYNVTDVPLLPATTSSNYYKLGQGQNGYNKPYTTYSRGTCGTGGGGGGYYGGKAHQSDGTNSDIGGAGGTGYIGGVSNGTTSNGVRPGNGFARITTNFEWAF